MLETLFDKAKNGVQKQSQKLVSRLPAFSSGVGIVIAVIVLVGGRLLWVHASRPAHRQAIADALGSDRLFYGDAQLNHDGSMLTYVSTSDKGFGLFLYDLATNQKREICEQNHLGHLGETYTVHAWPWSPDDRYFIYSTAYTLNVCPVDPAKAFQSVRVDVPGAASLDLENFYESSPTCFNSVVWVNPGEFAFQTGDLIGYARRQPDGHWTTHWLPYKNLPNPGPASCLTAASDDSIAWLMNGSICRVHLTEDMTGSNDPFTITPATAKLEANIKSVTFVAPPAAQPPTDRLFFWCDAATLEQSNQSPVLQLADLSPGKNNLVPDGKSPTYNAPDSPRALNGRGTVHFSLNGSVTNASGLKTSANLGMTGPAPRTVFAVIHRDAGSQMLLGMGDDSSAGTYFGLCDQNDGLYLPSIGKKGNLTAPSDGSWMITEVVYDGTNQTGYVNGRFRGRTAFSLKTAGSELELGLRTGTNTVGSDGDFAELLVYDQALSPAARQQVENYLNLKWFGNSLLLPGNPAVWCDPAISGIASFSYSKPNAQLLIKQVEDNGRNALWRFDPRASEPDKATKIVEAGSITGEQWAGSKACAYTSADPSHHGVAVADAFGTGMTRWFEPQSLNWFKVTEAGDKLFFGGTISNEPSAEIGQYDLGSGQFQTAVPYADYPSVYAKNIQPYQVSLTLPSGRTVLCTVFPPAHFDPHKKYPLLLGDTQFFVTVNGPAGRLWIPAISTCGAYVIFIERYSWWQLDHWESDILEVYHVMANDPAIDPQRVFVFGSSAETEYLSKLLTDSPGLWKGAVFLNPGGLPDFSKSPPLQSRPEILISAGGDEQEDDRFKRFQAKALKSGVMVDYIIHPGEGHHLVGNAAQLERTRAIMHFMFEE
jgi:hypothetical protein